MKTRDELDAMTKAEIEAYAAEVLPIEVKSDQTKAAMIDAVIAAQEAGSVAEALEGSSDAGPGETQTPSEPDSTRIRIHHCCGMDPAIVQVNGRRFEFPLERRITVPTHVLPTLDAAGADYTKE